MTKKIDSAMTSSIVAEFGARPEMLVQILQNIVTRFGWIPEDAIRQLADELNLSRADVHGVVQYYHDFRTTPPGSHVIKICQAEACQAMGSRELTDYAKTVLSMDLNETADDVTLEPVYCLGNCACSPAIMVDNQPYGRVDEHRFNEILQQMRSVS